MHNEEISFSILNWSTEVLCYPLLVTAPVRKECCRDLKTRTSDMVSLTLFGSSLPPVISLTFKKNATMAEDVGIVTQSPQRSHRRFTDLALLISHKSLLRLRPRPRRSPSPDGWVSLIKDLEFTIDKKFGQLLLRYSTWHCRATPSSPQFHPSDLLVHSLSPGDTSAEQATWAELRGQKALDMRNSFYTAPYVSRSPKEKQASSLTKNMLPELLHFEFAVP